MGLGGDLHEAVHLVEEDFPVASGPVGVPGKVEGHVLEGAEAELPGGGGVEEVCLVKLEAQAAALGELHHVPPVEDEIGIPLLGGEFAGEGEHLLPPLLPEEVLRDVEQGLGEEKGLPPAVPFEVDREEGPEEGLRLGGVLAVGPPRLHPSGADGRHVPEMSGHLVVEVDVREGHLPSPAAGELVELEDEHLGELADPFLRKPREVGGEKGVDGVPADGPGEVVLQDGGHLEEMGQEHVGVPGGGGDARDGGQIQAVLRHVGHALSGAVGAVDHAEIVEMDVPREVGVRRLLREDLRQGVLLQGHLGDGEVDGLGVMGGVAVLPVGVEHHGLEVMKGDADAAVVLELGVEPPLKELHVHEVPDYPRGDPVPPPPEEIRLHIGGDLAGEPGLHSRLLHQGVPDPPGMPGVGLLMGQGIHHEGKIRGLPPGGEHDHLAGRGIKGREYLFFSVLHFGKPPFHP